MKHTGWSMVLKDRREGSCIKHVLYKVDADNELSFVLSAISYVEVYDKLKDILNYISLVERDKR